MSILHPKSHPTQIQVDIENPSLTEKPSRSRWNSRPRLAITIVFAVVFLVVAPTLPSVEAGSNARDRGAETFATHGCVHCHGPAGVGGGRGPDLQHVRKRLNATQITTQIHNGGKSMPAYGDQLTSEEISDLVAYLRAKRKFIAVPPPPPDSPKPDPTR